MINMFNKSHPYHFVGAFFFGIVARLLHVDDWIKFAIVTIGGIVWEIVQFERWRAKRPELTLRGAIRMYWYIDTFIDVIMNTCGAAFAIFPAWWV